MAKPLPVPAVGYPSHLSAVIQAMASDKDLITTAKELNMDELEKDKNVKMKLLVQVTNSLWGGNKDNVYKKSYAELLEHIIRRNSRVKRRDEQNPEVTFYELARGIKESNLEIQEKKKHANHVLR